MSSERKREGSNASSSGSTPWTVVNTKSRGKTQRIEEKSKVKFQVHLNHFYDVEPLPFDILVDVPAENCINCLGPRHFRCDKSQRQEYCFNCGRSGVRVNTCPRCRKAYPAYNERREQSGLGRDTRRIKVQPVDKKPVEPVVAKMDSLQPVNTDSQAYTQHQTHKETASLASVLKRASVTYNAQLTTDDIGSYDEKIIESRVYYEITIDYLLDLKSLMDRIKNLDIDIQNSIVLHFASERDRLFKQ